MRSNIMLDDALVEEAKRLTGVQTKKELVDLALRELVHRYKQRALRELVDRDLIAPDYDVRAMRAAMTCDSGR